MSAELAEALAGAVGAEHVELLGDGARVRPGAAAEVASIVAIARARSLTVSAGEGSGAAVRIDLARIGEVLHLDETSLLVHVQAGALLGDLDGRLRRRRMSLGAAARASGYRRVGAALAGPRPTEASPRGRLLDLCAGVDAVLPDGTLIHTRVAPRRATGPDLQQLLLGARGATGIVVGAWLRCEREPPARQSVAWSFPDGASAIATLRTLLDRGARPWELALASGESLAAAGLSTGEVLLVAALAGTPELVEAERALLGAIAGPLGGRGADGAIAEDWLSRPSGSGGAEQWVSLRDLAAAWAARAPRVEVTGIHLGGAAISDAGTPSAAPPAPRADPLDELRDAIARALDPAQLLVP